MIQLNTERKKEKEIMDMESKKPREDHPKIKKVINNSKYNHMKENNKQHEESTSKMLTFIPEGVTLAFCLKYIKVKNTNSKAGYK